MGPPCVNSLAITGHVELLGRESNPSCSFDLSRSCSSAGLGADLRPIAPERLPVLSHHSENSIPSHVFLRQMCSFSLKAAVTRHKFRVSSVQKLRPTETPPSLWVPGAPRVAGRCGPWPLSGSENTLFFLSFFFFFTSFVF